MSKHDRSQRQFEKLNQLLTAAWQQNRFYNRKWTDAGFSRRRIVSFEDFARIPFTTRDELVRDQECHPLLGMNLTSPFACYNRIYRSSGTTRQSVFWGDTPESWQWVMRCSRELFVVAGIKPLDRLLCFLTFGCSSGPWIIYEGAGSLGCRSLVAPAADPPAWQRLLNDFQPNVLVGKPSVLHRFGESLAKNNCPLPSIEKLILTGEPSRNTIRPALEQLWSALAFDRYGMTEAGSIASECPSHSGGLHLLDEEFIAECISPETGIAVEDGGAGELVLTNLGRIARPIIRYRTGDAVRLVKNQLCACGRKGAFLLGGIHRMAHSETGQARENE